MTEADELWEIVRETRRENKLLAAELEQARHERDEARAAMVRLRTHLFLASWITPSASNRIYEWMDEHCPWLKSDGD